MVSSCVNYGKVRPKKKLFLKAFWESELRLTAGREVDEEDIQVMMQYNIPEIQREDDLQDATAISALGTVVVVGGGAAV